MLSSSLSLFEFIVLYMFPVIVFFFGLFGNAFGYLVLFRKKLKTIGPRHIYQYLFIMDTIYLLQIVNKYLQFCFGLSLKNYSQTWCKVSRYFAYSLDAVSPMLLVYISVERLVSIKKPAIKFIFRKEKVQLVYFLIVFVFNAVYYLPIAFYSDLPSSFNESFLNSSENQCSFINEITQEILSILDAINLIIVPFTCMLVCSILLTRSIFLMKRRIIANFLQGGSKTIRKDIWLSVMTTSLNIIYLILNLPLAVISFYTNFTDFTFVLFIYIFFASYAVNFYVIFSSNSLFRNEFFLMFSEFLTNLRKRSRGVEKK